MPAPGWRMSARSPPAAALEGAHIVSTVAATSAWWADACSQPTCTWQVWLVCSCKQTQAARVKCIGCQAAKWCAAAARQALRAQHASQLDRNMTTAHLDDCQPAAQLLGQPLQHWQHHSAGAAPRGRKVDQDELRQCVAGWEHAQVGVVLCLQAGLLGSTVEGTSAGGSSPAFPRRRPCLLCASPHTKQQSKAAARACAQRTWLRRAAAPRIVCSSLLPWVRVCTPPSA